MTQHFDSAIIGVGQAGAPLARALAASGQRVAVIEREHVGGTCVNIGCTPTKTMVASARVAHVVRGAADYGVQRDDAVNVDFRRVRERKRDIVTKFRSGLRDNLEDTDGLTLFDGEASFIDAHTLHIALNSGGTETLTADTVFINTGQRARIPNIDGIDTITIHDEASMMELESVPSHLVIVGGGYIGVEFGQMFRRFGSDVTIIHHGEHLLPHEDDDIAGLVHEIFAEDGITLLLNSKATRFTPTEEDGVSVTVKMEDDTQTTITGSHVMIAVGRVPNTDKLNLEAAGVTTDKRGYIQVDSRLKTSAENIYALGDVAGSPAFTHIAYDDFRIVRENLLNGGDRTTEDRPVPYTVFMDPQLGRVGMTENEAREAGINYRVAELPMKRVARALEVGETRGKMKAIINADDGQILGFAILGVDGGEVASVVQVAMMGKLPYTVLRDGVFSHPTTTESLNNLFMTLD